MDPVYEAQARAAIAAKAAREQEATTLALALPPEAEATDEVRMAALLVHLLARFPRGQATVKQIRRTIAVSRRALDRAILQGKREGFLTLVGDTVGLTAKARESLVDDPPAPFERGAA
jgi:hypothetical protein